MNYHTYKTALGYMTVSEKNSIVKNVCFGKHKFADGKEYESETIKQAIAQITQYLKGERQNFSLNIEPEGTCFQKNVWQALLKIPYGKTKTYKDIACEIGNPKAARAVGMANNKNPIAIIIPCHRVIGAKGKLTGYAAGLLIKEKLLNIESCF